MSTATAPAKARAAIGERTLRKDNWRRYPIVTVVIFTSWLAYGLVRSLMGTDFYVEQYHYLTPFYSPCVNVECGEAALFGAFLPAATPFFIPFAVLSLPVLLLFRLSCYYYRKAYYRAYWASPPACAVREPHQSYTGERRFPLISQNLHRYTWFAAFIVSVINTWDVVEAFHGKDGGFGVGLGTLILLVDLILLWAYTMSCHSCRHIVGGRLKNFSKHPLRYWAWVQVSKLNERHGQLALITLGSLVVTDLYIALVAHGSFSDLRIFN
jgi:hypothetical protein